MSKICFDGYCEKCITFRKKDNSPLKKGDFVSISDNATVKTASAGDDIIGYCVDVNDDYATVQTAGYVKANVATGNDITLGLSSVTVDGSQKIVSSATAKKVLVLEIDTDKKTIGFII